MTREHKLRRFQAHLPGAAGPWMNGRPMRNADIDVNGKVLPPVPLPFQGSPLLRQLATRSGYVDGSGSSKRGKP